MTCSAFLFFFVGSTLPTAIFLLKLISLGYRQIQDIWMVKGYATSILLASTDAKNESANCTWFTLLSIRITWIMEILL